VVSTAGALRARGGGDHGAVWIGAVNSGDAAHGRKRCCFRK